MVSHEAYPTTTHTETLQIVLEQLQRFASKIAVGDDPAYDSNFSVSSHPLARVCKSLGFDFINLLETEMKNINTRSGFSLETSKMMTQFDVIISLPVLKFHKICGMTGALKNQFGFLSVEERKCLHFAKTKDINQAIAELNRIRKPDFFIVDALETMTEAQESRHGGKCAKIGYMFAGSDPVGLDTFGRKLLHNVDSEHSDEFETGSLDFVSHINYAIALGVGDPNVCLQRI